MNGNPNLQDILRARQSIHVKSWVRSMIQLPNKNLVVGGHKGLITVWDISHPRNRVAKIHNSLGILFVKDSAIISLSYIENKLISGDFDGQVKIWDINDAGKV